MKTIHLIAYITMFAGTFSGCKSDQTSKTSDYAFGAAVVTYDRQALAVNLGLSGNTALTIYNFLDTRLILRGPNPSTGDLRASTHIACDFSAARPEGQNSRCYLKVYRSGIIERGSAHDVTNRELSGNSATGNTGGDKLQAVHLAGPVAEMIYNGMTMVNYTDDVLYFSEEDRRPARIRDGEQIRCLHFTLSDTHDCNFKVSMNGVITR